MQNYSNKLHICLILTWLLTQNTYLLKYVIFTVISAWSHFYVCVYINLCIFPLADFCPVESDWERDEAVSAACVCVNALCMSSLPV